MTTGQRITQKRKELGLSQEGLGTQLGVSRQAIYKWEQDAALPEVEKLVALSRIFGVPVGWLLGVEETAAPDAAQAPQAGPNELTDAQLAMVEEIVGRYLAAAPKAAPAKKRRWPLLLAALAVCACLYLVNQISTLQDQYYNLNNSMNRLDNNIDYQIGLITNRVESILEDQNRLTADMGYEIAAVDHRANTITFSAYVVPRNYVQGSRVVFLAEHGSGPAVETEAVRGEGNRFSADVTCPLTDDITLSALFINGEEQAVQILGDQGGLYSGSFPSVDFYGNNLWGSGSPDDPFRMREGDRITRVRLETSKSLLQSEIAQLRVGLFCDRKLTAWATQIEKPANYETGGRDDALYFALPEGTRLGPEGVWCWAAVITDTAGRTTVQAEYFPVKYNADENFWDHADMDIEAWSRLDWTY